MKKISFFGGYDSGTTPTSEQINTSLLVRYIDASSYEAIYGTPIAGHIYYNTSDNLIHYHNGTGWITLNDHDSLLNKGTVSHSDLDTHYNDGDVHFEMLAENNMTSDSPTKTSTQRSRRFIKNNK